MSGAFRTSTFDPALNVAQLVCMQSLFYISVAVLVLFGAFARGQAVTLDLILAYDELGAARPTGWVVVVAYLLNAGAMSFALVPIVSRARLVLDFACTLHGLHLIVSFLYNGWRLPSALWWATNITAAAITAIGGEKLCMRRELEPISVGVGPRSGTAAARRKSSTAGKARNKGKVGGPKPKTSPAGSIASILGGSASNVNGGAGSSSSSGAANGKSSGRGQS
ncbi:hypothetical protein H9P43_007462 [Blastocladiella emersonii ATCC 22665]|nr:hypothetical protein H9P43_007462 [Blastocladiella emersonii ATCC 22665]